MVPTSKRSSKERGYLTPTTLRGRWLILSSFARIDVSASGGWGPACKPYQHVLQIRIECLRDDNESWTIYRNDEDGRKDGKIVFKKWDIKAAWENFRKWEGKPLPENWQKNTFVAEREFPVSSRWLKDLDRALSKLSVPPIAGPVRPFSSEAEHTLCLWRSWQKSEFSWQQNPPKEWKPIVNFHSSMVKNLRKHTDGAIPSIKKLLSEEK